jgi:TolB protein
MRFAIRLNLLLFPLAILAIFSGCRQRYELVFVSDRNGLTELYRTDTDTTFFLKLTESESEEYNPQWAPDGNGLIFIILRDGASDIAAVTADGENFRHLTRDPDMIVYAAWSPDGRKIVFNSNRDHPNGEIYSMKADGSGVRRLTVNQQTEISPRYTPDGAAVLHCQRLEQSFDGKLPPGGALYLLDTSGYPSRQLALSNHLMSMASLSPDGKRIVFQQRAGQRDEIVVMEAATGNLTNLTTGEPDSRWPSWSPDGRKIAYTRIENGNPDIWIMRIDGSGKRPLITSPYRDDQAAFRPRAKGGIEFWRH